jgi:hypothetical protein
MGTIYVSQIINKAMKITGDPASAQNSKAQMLEWLNEGEKALVKRKPDAYVKIADQLLTEGTKQSLASDGIIFIEPVCNMGTDGTTYGNVVYSVGREEINRSNPSWHADTASATVVAVIFDERNPKVFYTSPPQPATAQGYLRYEYSAIPPEITVTAGNYDVVFNVGDEYEAELLNYLLFRIYSNDTGQIADAVERARMYWSLFTGDIFTIEAVEEKNSPNVPRR